MFPSPPHSPHTFWEWFDQNVKFIFVALTAIGAAALVMIAMNSTQPVAAGTVAGPIPTFGTEATPKVKVAFMGDSYTAGTGATTPAKRWTSIVAATLGWDELNFGRGGTGFNGGSTVDGVYRESYPEMIPQVAAAAPDVVIVSTAGNDLDSDPAAVKSAIKKFFASLRSSLPTARIITLSPTWRDTAPPSTLQAMQSALAESTTAVGGEYVDVGSAFAKATGVLAPDKVHPNDKGHALIAKESITALRQLSDLQMRPQQG